MKEKLIFIVFIIIWIFLIICNYLEIDKALLILTSFIATYIAYQQYRTNRYKLMLDLFEKRYKVYDATRIFLTIIKKDASFEIKDLQNFNEGILDSCFLFDDDISAYLNQIREDAVDMRTANKKPDEADRESEYLI
ncbi:MAG: hypothetical protein QG567_2524, partial [Campylobacterota bacterium]|nr:hypothetical protein [Campylobacterota bacterium]